ncbi:sugar phosphate isomerase/epimerase family protein [Nakamurella aerolata]|uniref:Sugar phosphate isomerase/epimerase n=1 Tax=Nakamurella aerolata TaxID=1656892 RepID=A0A849A8R8_9ACTN|nr:sugar phosphate isomerase/epimerase [Nakamurella aerolata]NNG35498.1 sugar phosphate isomerase/epimerase [Nakamurella aerolata]
MSPGQGRPDGYPDHRPPRPQTRVTLSTSSAYPETVGTAFAMAADAGYDGMEVMVLADPVTQDANALLRLMNRHQLPITSIHSPCLLLTARVWSTDPLVKLARSLELAERVGAQVVVVHPPFVWQRTAASDFAASVAELQQRTEVKIAVENMYPVRRGPLLVNGYRPHWNPVPSGHAYYTLDLSHAAASGVDALQLAEQMSGNDRAGLAHLHLTDGSGAARDEHLVPGRGTQPAAELLNRLRRGEFHAEAGFTGSVCVEISTRGAGRAKREQDLAESLAFARLHLS